MNHSGVKQTHVINVPYKKEKPGTSFSHILQDLCENHSGVKQAHVINVPYKKEKPGTSFSHILQDLCESRGGRPGLSVLTSLLVSVDVKLY